MSEEAALLKRTRAEWKASGHRGSGHVCVGTLREEAGARGEAGTRLPGAPGFSAKESELQPAHVTSRLVLKGPQVRRRDTVTFENKGRSRPR